MLDRGRLILNQTIFLIICIHAHSLILCACSFSLILSLISPSLLPSFRLSSHQTWCHKYWWPCPNNIEPPDHTNRPWLMVPADGPMGKWTPLKVDQPLIFFSRTGTANIDKLAEKQIQTQIQRGNISQRVPWTSPHPIGPGYFHPLCNRHGWISPIYKAYSYSHGWVIWMWVCC